MTHAGCTNVLSCRENGKIIHVDRKPNGSDRCPLNIRCGTEITCRVRLYVVQVSNTKSLKSVLAKNLRPRRGGGSGVSPIIDVRPLAELKNGMEQEIDSNKSITPMQHTELPSRPPTMGSSAISIDYPDGVPTLARDMQSVVLTNQKDPEEVVSKGVRK
uniref:Uncharacterized protein n=1 Tax=Lotharella globosa TaxID=91324 RepID=A0A7S3YAM3_9EUKA